MIPITCPGCGTKLKAPDEARGKRMKCPKCASVITVEEQVYDAEVVPSARDDFDPYGLADEPGPPKASSPFDGGGGGGGGGGEARRPCPMCGEMIVASAAKCRYCGEVFDKTLKKAESKKKKRKSYSSDEEDMSGGDWVVAILCSGIGCIAGIVWMLQGKPKGKKMIGVSVVCIVIWNVISLVIRTAAENQNNLN